jgi:hypothetical protein
MTKPDSDTMPKIASASTIGTSAGQHGKCRREARIVAALENETPFEEVKFDEEDKQDPNLDDQRRKFRVSMV